MLAQWLISIALSVGVSLGSMEGFLLISKCHYAQRILSEEQSQVRFLVSFLRGMLHSAILPGQECGGIVNHENPLIPVSGTNELQLNCRVCSEEEGHFSIIPHRFYIQKNKVDKGISLSLQQGNKRKEVLITGIQFFSIAFCSKNSTPSCTPAADIQDWSRVEAVEFKLQFQDQPGLEHLVFLENHHQWHFRIRIGSHHETQ